VSSEKRPAPSLGPDTPFGDKYVLIRHLATGGMAELYLARQSGLAGFEKELVIKRILPRYVEHTKVVKMFIDEARIAASLNHPNIVHIYDIGQQDGSWYIAMEYIHGENLWSVARRGIEAKNFLPLEHAIKVVSMVCEGLEYAHAKTDNEKRPLRIVHRDISPSNILVTYEGVAKIVDFGIARAENQMREERGLVAGKCHYMSPEALRGERIDQRSDIWSIGVVLWEMTLGRRLFKGTPVEVARRVADEGVPPPTFIRRDYPPALEQVVMRALEKHQDDRYGTAGEMMQDLEDFLVEHKMRTSSLRIGKYVKELFAKEVHASPEDAARAAEFGEGVEERAEPAEEELDFDRRSPSLLAGMDDDAAHGPPSEPEIEKISDDMEDEKKAAPPAPEDNEAENGNGVILASRLEERSASGAVIVDKPVDDDFDDPKAPSFPPPSEVPKPVPAKASAPVLLNERRSRTPMMIALVVALVGVAAGVTVCASKAHSSPQFDRDPAHMIKSPR
jgi:serine/threonine protein kinase